MKVANAGDPCMTPAVLAAAIENLLHAADRLGLADVGIKLNEAVVALGRDGVVPAAEKGFRGEP